MDRSSFVAKYGPYGIHVTGQGGGQLEVSQSDAGALGTASSYDEAASIADAWIASHPAPGTGRPDPPDVQG